MIKIKRRTIMDLIVYIASPLGICAAVGINNFKNYTIHLIITGILYTLFTKYKQKRFSISGVSIMTLITCYIYFAKNYQSGFELYVYSTYIIGILSIIALLLNLLNRNICSQIYIDILNTKPNTKISMNSIMKKRKLDSEFRFLSTIMILHFVVLAFTRFYSIINYGLDGYSIVYTLELFMSSVFLSVEFYWVYKIILDIKENNFNKRNMNNLKEGIVINLNHYRGYNK